MLDSLLYDYAAWDSNSVLQRLGCEDPLTVVVATAA